jgi:hypothetical protein
MIKDGAELRMRQWQEVWSVAGAGITFIVKQENTIAHSVTIMFV